MIDLETRCGATLGSTFGDPAFRHHIGMDLQQLASYIVVSPVPAGCCWQRAALNGEAPRRRQADAPGQR
jgi:hypothetical protein